VWNTDGCTKISSFLQIRILYIPGAAGSSTVKATDDGGSAGGQIDNIFLRSFEVERES
jgi:hypothetical protein